ncbi:MAG: tetratricopeptide repeat protein [Thermoanaerobaculia bacterium]
MSYPGDPALSADVKQRILTTFQQTLDLASKGNRQESLLGCDFILRLDPQFGPARTLQQLVQAGRSGPQLAELLGGAAGVAPASAPSPSGAPRVAEPASDSGSIFGDLALDLPEAPSFASTGGEGLENRLAQLLAQRRFGDVIAAAELDKRAVAADARLRQIVELAHARLEAGPYVKTFVDSARQALQAGEKEEAERLIRKAKALDPEHPDLLALDDAQKYYADPDRAMGARRQGIEMEPEPAAAVAGGGGDLDLPEVDFSFAGMAEDDYSLSPEIAPAAGDAEGGGEHSGRIEELLKTGQEACDRGEFQAAIDAWSRIFLIDIDHQEAARRIERARQLKAEREREVEEIFHEGVAKFDSGSFDLAETAFKRVLDLSPGYLVAQDYLEKIEERQAGGGAIVPGGLGGIAPGTPRAGDPLAGGIDGGRAAGRGARERTSGEILVPPEPGSDRGRAGERPDFAVAIRRGKAPARGFLWIGGAVLLLLLAGGWLLLRNRARLFPNSQEPAQAAAPTQSDPIARAKALNAEGKTAVAIAQLRRLPPQEPSYAEAQSLISQWEALIKPAQPVPAGPSPARMEKRRALVETAERACREQEFLRCDRALAEAATILALEPSNSELKATAQQGLIPLTDELKMFADGDLDFLLNKLWRRREAEPGNRDVKRLIVDSYYNLGVLDLQRGDPPAAADKFREALALDPSDEPLQRLQQLATTYSQRSEDLLFEIFVRYVPTR